MATFYMVLQRMQPPASLDLHRGICYTGNPMRQIEIVAASTHNLREVSLNIPKNRMVVVTGVSGSGKSSLAYDTLFQEGQRRYLESLSVYARQFIKSLEKPAVRSVRGISPTISIDQKHSSYFFNSTVGTISEISPFLRLIYARAGKPHCPRCNRPIQSLVVPDLADLLVNRYGQDLIHILAPVVRNRKGLYRELFDTYRKRGFLKAIVDGEWVRLDESQQLDRNRRHDIAVLIDAVEPADTPLALLRESLELAMEEGNGEILVRSGQKEKLYSRRLYCAHCRLALREPQPATFSLNSPLGACPACRGTGRDDSGAVCEVCRGGGYGPDALAFRFRDLDIHALGEMEIRDLHELFAKIQPDDTEEPLLSPLLPQIRQRLDAFMRLRLDYLSLNRRIHTLSGGELQRTRLVSQIGFQLSGVIYVLDEPSIGMHMSEVADLVAVLRSLRDAGNTVVVVEHDPYTIASSDWVVDLGPGSGEAGGRIIFNNDIRKLSSAKNSLTADYLLQRRSLESLRGHKTPGKESIRIAGLKIHNVDNVDVEIPCGILTVVTGVSGSGKSSLVMNALVPLARARLVGDRVIPEGVSVKSLVIPDSIRRVLEVDQGAIGRNARSCPATYVGLMTELRQLFAETMEARIRGYTPGRFSFNTRGGRCEACGGLGIQRLEMGFLPRLDVTCPVCGGTRFNTETRKVRYKGRSIDQVLDMTVDAAATFFAPVPGIATRLRVLQDVGLGYLRLGQPSVTLSGGESQRIKLGRELGKRSAKPTLIVLDEPTVGLHAEDIRKLIAVMDSLVQRGGTVVVIEHNAQVIRAADWVVDLGPGGGRHGGRVLYQGALDGFTNQVESVTARWLQDEDIPGEALHAL